MFRGNGVGFEPCEVVFEAPLLVLCWCRGVKTNGGRAGTSTSVGLQSHAHLHNKGFYIKTINKATTSVVCGWIGCPTANWLFVSKLFRRRFVSIGEANSRLLKFIFRSFYPYPYWIQEFLVKGLIRAGLIHVGLIRRIFGRATNLLPTSKLPTVSRLQLLT